MHRASPSKTAFNLEFRDRSNSADSVKAKFDKDLTLIILLFSITFSAISSHLERERELCRLSPSPISKEFALLPLQLRRNNYAFSRLYLNIVPIVNELLDSEEVRSQGNRLVSFEGSRPVVN